MCDFQKFQYKSIVFNLRGMKSLQQQPTPSIADSLCTLVRVYISQTSMIFAADFALGCPLWQVVHKAVMVVDFTHVPRAYERSDFVGILIFY